MVDGMKIGYIFSVGYLLIILVYCLVFNGECCLILVVIGIVFDQVCIQESQKLLNWGFQNFDVVKLYVKGQVVDMFDVWKGLQSKIKVGFKNDVYIIIFKGMVDKVKIKLECNDLLIVLILENVKVGILKVIIDDKIVVELLVIVLELVGLVGFIGCVWDLLCLMFK